MATWSHTLDLPASPDDIFALLAQPARRPELSPPEWKLQLIDGPAVIEQGSLLRWKLRRAGLTQHLITRITAYDPLREIVEQQHSGPLRRWEHTVHLEPSISPTPLTRLHDRIDFEPPAGLLGLALKEETIRGDLAKSFAVRDVRLRQLFPAVNPLAGIVLCGGRSSRMGRPKAWLPFGPELMLPRVVRILSDVVRPIVVVAAGDQDLPPLPAEVHVVRDEVAERGPLQGLAAGLRALQGEATAAYVTSCDVPFLTAAWILRVHERLGNAMISVPRVGEFHHPLAAVYRLETLEWVDRLLAENRLRPTFLFDAVPTRVLSANDLQDLDPTFRTLRNLNTPEDYEAALGEAGFPKI